jgi:hypothetical protein
MPEKRESREHREKQRRSRSTSCSSSSSEQIVINVKKNHNKKSDSDSSRSSSHKKKSQSPKKRYSKKSDCSTVEYSNDKKKKHSKKSSKRSSSSSHSSSSDDCSFEDIYKYYKYRLVTDKCLQVAGSDSYINSYNTNELNIPRGSVAPINTNTISYNLDHLYEGSPFYVRKAGLYMLFFKVDTNQASQFAIFVNGVAVDTTRIGSNSGAGQVVLRAMLRLKLNDAVLIRNSESVGVSVVTSNKMGGLNIESNITFVMMKLGPYEAPEDVEWDDKCLSKKNKYLFRKLTEKMLSDKELMLKGFNIHGSFSSTNAQVVLPEAPFLFDAFNQVNGLVWNPTGSNPEQVQVSEDGVYKLFFSVNTTQAAQICFAVNGVPVTHTTEGINRGASELTIRALLPLNKNDLVTVHNYTSLPNITTVATAGGSGLSNSIMLTVFKIAPLCKPSINECKLSAHHKKCYEKFRNYLLAQCELQIAGPSAYSEAVSDVAQQITVGNTFDFNYKLENRNIEHRQGSDSFTVKQDGVYDFFVDLATNEAVQLSLYVNGVVEPTTVFGRDSGGSRLLLRQFLALKCGDRVTVNNNLSNATSLTTAVNAGGQLVGENLQLIAFRLSAYDRDCNKCSKDCSPKKLKDKKPKDKK